VRAAYAPVVVRFHVFGAGDLPLEVVAARIGRALDVRLEERVGSLRGRHYRWSDPCGADVLVQSVTPEDAELLDLVDGCVVYTTALDDAAYDALEGMADLRLLDADLIPVA
jgi:hypothetical protein